MVNVGKARLICRLCFSLLTFLGVHRATLEGREAGVSQNSWTCITFSAVKVLPSPRVIG